jgi:hypothetical protein
MRDRILGNSLGSLLLHPWIRGCLVAGSLAGALCVSHGTASADDTEQRVYSRLLGEDLDVWKTVDGRLQVVDKDERELVRCDYHLAGLTKANAPDSLTFELEHDTPELKAGKHRWTEARAACASIMAVAESRKKISSLNWVIFNCKDEMARGLASNLPHFENAQKTYDEAIAAGMSPTQIISVQGVTGTIGELYEKWCTAGRVKLQAAEDARSAPFKKLLKNDKLRIALQDTDYIMLPGGAKATPDRLAATNVWFEDASPSKVCPNGAQVHVLHRYQFNAQQKLAKVTDHEFCGRPPASAFR